MMKDNERYYRILDYNSFVDERFIEKSWEKIDFKEEMYVYIKWFSSLKFHYAILELLKLCWKLFEIWNIYI